MESSESSDDAGGEARAGDRVSGPTRRMPPPSTPSPQSPLRGDSRHACACCHHGEASHDPSCLYPLLVGEGEKGRRKQQMIKG
jgi:hypothetical protein